MNADDFVGGHSILALERFMDETRHMIIFDVLSWKSPVGEKGERLRLFLSDVGYEQRHQQPQHPRNRFPSDRKGSRATCNDKENRKDHLPRQHPFQ